MEAMHAFHQVNQLIDISPIKLDMPELLPSSKGLTRRHRTHAQTIIEMADALRLS
jgi:hypothetical protein